MEVLGVPTSAEVGLGRCPKNPRPFEKGRSKLFKLFCDSPISVPVQGSRALPDHDRDLVAGLHLKALIEEEDEVAVPAALRTEEVSRHRRAVQGHAEDLPAARTSGVFVKSIVSVADGIGSAESAV